MSPLENILTTFVALVSAQILPAGSSAAEASCLNLDEYEFRKNNYGHVTKTHIAY